MKKRFEREMDDELRAHLELRIQENMRAGMLPEEARLAALKQFGWVESIKEECRDGWAWRRLEEFGQDLVFGARMLRKNLGFTAVAVLTIAFGIGANTALFSLINAVLLRTLPVANPEQLAQAVIQGKSNRDYSFSFPFYEKLRAEGRSFSGIFAAGGLSRGVFDSGNGEGAEAEFVWGQPVTGDFFEVLGARPQAGRLLNEADDPIGKAQPVAVISHGFWQRRFGSDPSVVGRRVRFNEASVTIVGIAAPGFFGFQPGESPDLWWPLQLVSQVHGSQGAERLREGSTWLRVVGRVPSHNDFQRAQAEFAVVYEREQAERAAEQKGKLTQEELERASFSKMILLPADAGWSVRRDGLRSQMGVLAVVMGLGLLITCANVASLQLARAAARGRELCVRGALGASRGRLLRQMLTESVTLAALGGAMGLAVAQLGTRALSFYLGLDAGPDGFDVRLDFRTLSFAFALSLLVGLVFGLAPAWRGSRQDVSSGLKGEDRSAQSIWGQFLQRGLVITQVAVSLMLLVGTTLFTRTLKNLQGVDMGFEAERVMLFQLGLSKRIDPPARAALYKSIIERIEQIPGVTAASATAITPLTENTWGQRIRIDGEPSDPNDPMRCFGMSVGSRYFEAMGIGLVAGRDFRKEDESTNSQSVAIINEVMAQKYFNGAALGRRFAFPSRPDRPFEIVGVVKDTRNRSLRTPAEPTFYVSAFQELRNWDMAFVARKTGTETAAATQFAVAAREVDPTVKVQTVRSMEEIVNNSLRAEKTVADVSGLFSFAALGLACLGLYETLNFAVTQRTREIGTRIALGAGTLDVLRLVTGDGLKLTLLGGALGSVAALFAIRLGSKLLYGVEPTDPVTLAVAGSSLIFVTLAASWLPARRALKVEPMAALRQE